MRLFLALFAFPFFWLVDGKSTVVIALAITLGLVGHSAMYGPQAAFFSELFGTRVRARSRLRFGTTTPNFACVFATMEKVSNQKPLRQAAPDTGVCWGCGNVRNESEPGWISGAEPEPARKSS